MAVALLVLVAGAVFIGQGTGLVRGQSYLGRSFMVGDPRWAVIGAAMVVASIVALWRALQRPSRGR